MRQQTSEQHVTNTAIENAVRQIIVSLGMDPNDPNFRDTPKRVRRMYQEMFDGLNSLDDLEKILAVTFPSDYKGIVIHNNMLVFSFCPHHLLPVEMDISVAYIAPKTVGLSKVPRAIELLARRPVLQETLTHEITDLFVKYLDAQGALTVVRGKHSCMRIRGVRTLSDVVITSDVQGFFKDNPDARSEALRLLGENRNAMV